MKKEIPKSVIVAIAVIAVAIIGGIWYSSGRTEEYKAPEIASKGIPAHIFDAMPKETQDEMKAKGHYREEGAPSSGSGSQSTPTGNASPGGPTPEGIQPGNNPYAPK